MKTILLLILFSSCFLFQSLNATIFLFYTKCNETVKELYVSDSYSVSWTPPAGNTSCSLALEFWTERISRVNIYAGGGGSSRCYARPSSWSCWGSPAAMNCPVIMYTTSKHGSKGSIISNSLTKSVYSDYVKFLYCDNSGMSSTVSIFITASSSNNNYWYLTPTWQFIYIGIPIIIFSTILLILVIIILHKNRKYRLLQAQKSQMSPTVAIVTSGGSTNPGYQSTLQGNQPYYYPQEKSAFNPPGFDSKNIQEAMKQ